MADALAALIVRRYKAFFFAVLAAAVLCAFLLPLTGVNYDLTRYLGAHTVTGRSTRVMEREFGKTEVWQLVFRNRTAEQAASYVERLGAMEGILNAAHDPLEGAKVLEGAEYRLVRVTAGGADLTALAGEIGAMFLEDGDYELSGVTPALDRIQRVIAREIPLALAITALVIALVLLLTSRSFLEPLLVMLALAAAVLLNMGTNWVFGSVSFVTHAVSAILQLALSMDYAIMLLHAYDRGREEGLDDRQALRTALTACLMPVASSAATTMAGLLSLLFMSFTIGFDIGLVLSKGIFFSMLSVFLFLPGLVLLFDRPLRLCAHRSFVPAGRRLAGAVYALRGGLTGLLLLLVAAGAFLQAGNTFVFTDAGSMGTASLARRVFGESNGVVLLLPSVGSDEDYGRQRALVEGLPAAVAGAGPVSLRVNAMVTDAAAALRRYTPQEAAEAFGLSPAALRLFFAAGGLGESARGDELLRAAARALPGDARVAELLRALSLAESVYESGGYARVILTTDLPFSGESTRLALDGIRGLLERLYPEGAGIVSASLAEHEISSAFGGDLLRVSLISVAFILLIVALSFRSLAVPALLVLVIQGAIWMNMAAGSLLDKPIFFFSYILCVAIQMGATIDYGILLTDQYRRSRRGLGRREALGEAVSRALPTVLSSGTILVVAGFAVGRVSTVYYISSIGLLLARGGLMSMLLVLTLLPGLLLALDRQVTGTTEKAFTDADPLGAAGPARRAPGRGGSGKDGEGEGNP